MCQHAKVYGGNRKVMCFPGNDRGKTLMAASLMDDMVIHTGKEGGQVHRHQHAWAVSYSHQFFFYLVKPDKTGQVLGFEMTGYCIMDHLF